MPKIIKNVSLRSDFTSEKGKLGCATQPTEEEEMGLCVFQYFIITEATS